MALFHQWFSCVWAVPLARFFFAISNHDTLLKTTILIPIGVDSDFVELKLAQFSRGTLFKKKNIKAQM